METRRIISEIENGNYDNLVLDIYVDEDKISYQKQRYVNAIESYIEEGAQKIGEGIYGKSITDPCLGWEKSQKLIYEIADMI